MTIICIPPKTEVWQKLDDPVGFSFLPADRPEGSKRIRLTCLKCGRRLWSSVQYNQDGDYIIHTLPPHKEKGWWKKKKPKPKVRRKIR